MLLKNIDETKTIHLEAPRVRPFEHTWFHIAPGETKEIPDNVDWKKQLSLHYNYSMDMLELVKEEKKPEVKKEEKKEEPKVEEKPKKPTSKKSKKSKK